MKATFEADFSTFRSEVDKAAITLQRFEGESANVSQALSDMTNRFIGTKVISEATLMAAAIERIGGVSKLTATELQQVATVAAEAAAKFEAWGREVPANISALAGELNKTEAAVGGVSTAFSTLQGMLGAFGIQASIGGLVNFTRELFDMSDALVKASDQTGLSIAAIQRLQFVGDETSVSLDTMTHAIDTMEKRLASGDTSALKALDRLKVSVADLQTLSPEQKFYDIAAALKDTHNQLEMVRDSTALFGTTGAELLPALKQGFDDVRDAAIGMSEETVRHFDDTGDHLSHAYRSMKEESGSLFEFLFFGWSQAEADAKRYAEAAEGALSKALELAEKNLKFPTLPGASGKAPTLSPAAEHTIERELAKDFSAGLAATAKVLAENKREMDAWMANERAAFDLGMKLWNQGNKLLDDQNAKMEKRLALQTAFVTSLILEKQQAVDINKERSLGPGVDDPALKASIARDKALADIESKRTRAPEFDFGPMIQKIWQDFDEQILKRGAAGGGAGAVEINVSGVLDPRTIRELTDAVSGELMRRSGRQLPSA